MSALCERPPMPYFQVEAGGAQQGQVRRDLLRHRIWRPDVERSVRTDLAHERPLGRGRESAGFAEAADDLEVIRPELLLGRLVSCRDVTRPVHSDRSGSLPESLQGLLEELGERWETGRGSADDREHQREAVMRGAYHRLRAPADPEPDREGSVLGVGHADMAPVNR
jgi:hypothetical protein